MFVGLNPSTADETEDDQTIRRCVGFAMDWGYGGLCMGNLFAIRATKPKNMLIHLFREVWEKRTHSREVSPGWVGIC